MITNQVLYQLSYTGLVPPIIADRHEERQAPPVRYNFSNSRSRLVCTRLTGTTVRFRSSSFS